MAGALSELRRGLWGRLLVCEQAIVFLLALDPLVFRIVISAFPIGINELFLSDMKDRLVRISDQILTTFCGKKVAKNYQR